MSIWLHMEKGLSGKITYDIITNKETQERLPGFYNFWGGWDVLALTSAVTRLGTVIQGEFQRYNLNYFTVLYYSPCMIPRGFCYHSCY